jgi:hypothetical protein
MPSLSDRPSPDSELSSDLRSVISHAEDEAERLLDPAEGAPLDAVAWLSAHIAALDRAVYPVARRSGPDGRQLVARNRDIIARLVRLLRVVERRHSGDGLASGLSADRLFANLRSVVEEHHAAEAELVDRLVAVLSAADQEDLIDAYESALSHAPTRPHPYLSHGGLVFRFDSLRDRILDAMDGRHVPIPRVVKPHIIPGRWGSYLLGNPHSKPEESDRNTG